VTDGGAERAVERRERRLCCRLRFVRFGGARVTGALMRPVKGAPLRGRGGPCPSPLTGRRAGWGTAIKGISAFIYMDVWRRTCCENCWDGEGDWMSTEDETVPATPSEVACGAQGRRH
jgi:hypothetical protein